MIERLIPLKPDIKDIEVIVEPNAAVYTRILFVDNSRPQNYTVGTTDSTKIDDFDLRGIAMFENITGINRTVLANYVKSILIGK